MSAPLQLSVQNLCKRFGSSTIFSGMNFRLKGGDVLGVTGRNGSGKSTLMKLLSNVMERSEGTVGWSIGEEKVRDEDLPRHLGFVSPYLQLYTEYTAWEHTELVQQLRGLPFDPDFAMHLFVRMGLQGRRHDTLSGFSSGMLQRVRYICALIHSPCFLLLDEPANNLDENGIGTVRELVTEGSEQRITVIATNDAADLTLCNRTLAVDTGPAVGGYAAN